MIYMLCIMIYILWYIIYIILYITYFIYLSLSSKHFFLLSITFIIAKRHESSYKMMAVNRAFTPLVKGTNQRSQLFWSEI